jgi:hypothetical protein
MKFQQKTSAIEVCKDNVFAIWAKAHWLERCGTDMIHLQT